MAGNGEKTIIIDPGHGGADSGVVVGQLTEKEISIDLAKRLAAKLHKRGYHTSMTRNGDYFVCLRKRSAMVADQNGDVFISLHANAAMPSKKEMHGIEIYLAKKTAKVRYPRTIKPSEKLAGDVAEALQKANPSTPISIDKAPFWVLISSSVPAIMIEAGYMTDPIEVQLLNTPTYLDELAEAIAEGVDAYYGQKI